jgi:hypothetical protein
MNAKSLSSRAGCTQIIRRILGAGFVAIGLVDKNIRRILGVGIVAIGLVEIYNGGVSPTDRIAWAFLGIRILFFFGPLLLTIGAFLIFYKRPAGNQGGTDTQGDTGTQGDTCAQGDTDANSAAAGAMDAKGDAGEKAIRVQGSNTLLWVGGGLKAVPVGLIMANSSQSEGLYLFGGFAIFLFGLPGLVFIAIGAFRLKCLRLLLTTFSSHLRALWRDL